MTRLFIFSEKLVGDCFIVHYSTFVMASEKRQLWCDVFSGHLGIASNLSTMPTGIYFMAAINVSGIG